MKYEVVLDSYERYGQGDVCKKTFEAQNDLIAIALVLNNCQYGYYLKKGNKVVDEYGDLISKEELIEEINTCDGCDYIYSITNLDTNEKLYSDEQMQEGSSEEDWELEEWESEKDED